MRCSRTPVYFKKEGFLWGMYRKQKGLGLLWAKPERNKQIVADGSLLASMGNAL